MKTNENKLFVLDLETTGLVGHPVDKILEIAIIELDLETYEYKIRLNEVIKQEITEDIRNCWLVQDKHISIEEIKNGHKEGVVIERTKTILNGSSWTSYNTDYDWGKFLIYFGILPPVFCLMKLATPVVALRGHHPDYKHPKLIESYYWLVNRDWIDQDHRALTDTKMATKVAIELDKFHRRRKCVLEMLKHSPKKLRIIYQKRSGKLMERDILPIGLDGNQIKAYCYLRKEERNFRIDRIKAMGVIK